MVLRVEILTHRSRIVASWGSVCTSSYKIFNPVRSVFKQSGKWDPKLTTQLKKEIEEYWKPILHNIEHRPGRREKYYVLSMFPYPSGKLHMGHVRVYAISDSMARYRRLQGYEVIHPMGWDAFGLPAENAAVEKGMPAHIWTESNIAHMKSQLLNMGFDFDWKREIRTCDPSYYRWTQYIFLQLWEAGLVYQKEAFVNWDPVDQTVLANEQVDENGRSWRSGAVVERKLLKQWFIKTSQYATALRDGLNTVSNWFDVVDLQRHWIGEITGNRVTFEVWNEEKTKKLDIFSVFLENLTGLLGAAFVSIPPDHELRAKYKIDQKGRMNILCRNPFTGDFFPVFGLDAGQESEARLGVPSLSEADKVFADSNSLPFKKIFDSQNLLISEDSEFSGLSVEAANRKIAEKGEKYVSPPTSAKLKDWLISRQRYWGTPIPLILCSTCGPVPVPLEQLPVKLPLLDKISTKGGSLLAQQTDWLKTDCPKCGGSAKRETDTMDTFVDSSWYYLRYLDPNNEKVPFSREAAMKNMPVDMYIGGKEHALMHLFYARFIGYFLYSKGLLPQPEPFDQLLTQGFVQGKSYLDKVTGRYLTEKEVETKDGKTVAKVTGNEILEEWEKMSKSKMNGLDPDDTVAEYGVDATRLFMLGNVAPRSHRRWDPFLFKGLLNWQHYIWLIVDDFLGWNAGKFKSVPPTEEETKKHETDLFDSRNYYLKELDTSLNKYFGLNVALKKIQGLSTSLRKVPPSMMQSSPEFRKCLQQVIVMLYPFAPHFAAELWSGFSSVPKVAEETQQKQVWEMDWPSLDKDYKLDLIIKLCNDKLAVIKLSPEVFDSLTAEEAVSLAFQNEELTKFAREIGPTDSSKFTRTSDSEAVLDLNILEAGRKRARLLKEDKKARKAIREKKGSGSD